MISYILVAIGGAVGSVARFFCFELSNKFAKNGWLQISASFPVATFFVNIFGSLLAGIIYFLVIKNFDQFDLRLKVFLISGFLGGFTTFSAFSLDFFRLASAGQIMNAIIYALSSVILSILAVFFGYSLAKIFFS